MLLAASGAMGSFVYTCERCEECFAGKSYRVMSEDDGVRLLDMVVCYGCYLEASDLGLETAAVEPSLVALHQRAFLSM
jgi:hypothetical protein